MSAMIVAEKECTAVPVEYSLRPSNAQVGLWMFLATVIMLFAGFTSAILVRRAAPDWMPLPIPKLLWPNTAVLLASSLVLERARRAARVQGWLLGAAFLGLLFLAGQISAWRELAAKGLLVSSSPHSSFFYILTGAHGLHLAGGIVALSYALLRPRRPRVLKACAVYWQFLGALWVYLFVVLFVI